MRSRPEAVWKRPRQRIFHFGDPKPEPRKPIFKLGKKVKVKKPAATVVERAITEADEEEEEEEEEEEGLFTKTTAISMYKLSEGKWLQDQFRQECVEQGDQVRVLMCPLACRVQVEFSTGGIESDNSLAPLGLCAFHSQTRFFYLFAISIVSFFSLPVFLF